MADPLKNTVSDCCFMKLPKCHMQDVSGRLDLQICHACIAGRSEKHLFEIKEELAKLAQMIAARPR